MDKKINNFLKKLNLNVVDLIIKSLDKVQFCLLIILYQSFLFSWPRRFCKSMNLSMLKYFFELPFNKKGKILKTNPNLVIIIIY